MSESEFLMPKSPSENDDNSVYVCSDCAFVAFSRGSAVSHAVSSRHYVVRFERKRRLV